MPYARQDTITWTTGHYYHLYNRGARGLTIFPDEQSYLHVIKRAKLLCAQLSIAMIAYCLMPNHYHFLVRQEGEVKAGQLPQRIFNSYTKAYNRQHSHSGTLFQGRFGAKHVDDDAYLRYLVQYIHANPVKDGITRHVELWSYSNYLECIGQRGGTMVDQDFVDAHFHGAERYQRQLAEFIHLKRYLDAPDDLDLP